MDLIKAQIQKYPFLRNYSQAKRKKPAQTTKQVVCRFIGDFKVGDNLVRNADALCRLSASNENGVFNKLIVIQTGSIVEAALHEIIYRAQNFTREGVPNIPKADRDELATKNVELFNNIINVMK